MVAGVPPRWRTVLSVPLLLGLVLAALPPPAGAGLAALSPDEPAQQAWIFVENAGQYDPAARFLLLNGPGVTWLADDALWLTLWEGSPARDVGAAGLEEPGAPLRGVHLKLAFVDANRQPVLEARDRLATRISYFLGNDPGSWHADLPAWGEVRYHDLYPGIDLVLGGTGASPTGGLPWRLEVEAGADLSAVRLGLEGAEALSLEGGQLRLETAIGPLALPLPALVAAGGSAAVAGEGLDTLPVVSALESGAFEVQSPFALRGEQPSVETASAASGLVYSTFLGGGNWDWGFDVAVDASGAAYVCGTTPSANFPTVPGSFNTTLALQDAFVVKLNPGGGSLAYGTFLGGGSFESGQGIALDGGRAFVAGYTRSSNFPTTAGAYDRSCGTDGTCNTEWYDAFLAVLNASGTALQYGTFLGGGDQDMAHGLAVDGGVAFLAGQTFSQEFPTTGGAYDRSCGTDGRCNPAGGVPTPDAFFAKLRPAGGGAGDLLYGSYLGGSSDDAGLDVAASGGQAYLTGQTWSTDFPGGGYQGEADAFAVRLNAAGSGAADLGYSKLLGGSAFDSGEAIVVAGTTAYLTGETRSSNFPVTAGAYQGGANDAFLARLDSGGGTQTAVYVGGSSGDQGRGLALNAADQVILTGQTQSADFPKTAGSYDSTHNGGRDVFLILVEPSTAAVRYATFLGGSGDEEGYGLALDGEGQAFVTGYTRSSTSFPTTAGSFQRTFGGGTRDAFVAKMLLQLRPAISVEKQTNGQDADTPPGPYVPAGATVNWTYLVANTGSVELGSVSVSDDRDVAVSCPATTLQAGASMSCTGAGTAQPGQYANLATASGAWPATGETVSDTDASHYYGTAPSITLEKRTNGQDADSPPGPVVAVGGAVAWTYEVNNTGNVSLFGVVVSDDQGVAVSCPQTSLATGESMVCTASGTASAGQYANTATVRATPPDGLPDVTDADPSHYLGVNPAIALQKRTNGQDADLAPGPYVAVGDEVIWSYRVANIGDIVLVDIAVSDDQVPAITCPGSVLAPGGVMTCQAAGTSEAGQHANQATVVATALGSGMSISATDPSHYFGAQVTLELEKATNGLDADNPPGPLVLVGRSVGWTYTVANTGNVTLEDVTVVDDQAVQVSCPQSRLAPNSVMTCEATGTTVAGAYANVGTATGTPPGGLLPVTATDPSHYYGVRAQVAITKRTNGQDAGEPPGVYLRVGSTVNWTFEVRNTGNVALGDVVVTDNQEVGVSCPGSTLAPGEAMVCSAAGTVQAGQYANTGTVRATAPIGPAVTASDPSHYFGVQPGTSLTKLTNNQDASAPPGPTIVAGEAVNWTYRVANTGDVTLNGLAVSDDQGVAVSCPTTSLPPGQTIDCTASGIAQPGQYANLGTASGISPDGTTVSASDASYYLGLILEPGIDVQKQTNGSDADQPPGPYLPVGGAVVWDYFITNIGNTTLQEVMVEDDKAVAVSCPANTLEPGASMTCTGSGQAAAGQYSNLATASGTSVVGGQVVTDSDASHYFGSQPGLSLQKRTNGQDADEPPGPYVPVGEAVTWIYVIRNAGNVILQDITIGDDQERAVSCPGTTLAPGETMTCRATGTAQPGPYGNIATATGRPPVGEAVSATDASHYFGSDAGITLNKQTDGQDAGEPPGPVVPAGSQVNWTYRVANTGNVPLDSVEVSDDQGVEVSCPQARLEPGTAMVCTASGPAQAGQYANVGTVMATTPAGGRVSGSDASHYSGASPGITLKKRTNGQDAGDPPGVYVPVGEPVVWTYEVANTGNVDLKAVAVTDDQGLLVSCPGTRLAPGETMVCQASGVAEPGAYANLGTVSGRPVVGQKVSASDPSHYFGSEPGVALAKLTNGQEADAPPGPTIPQGQSVTWTYVVINTGNVALREVRVTDDQGVKVTCPQARLNVGRSMTCQASAVAQTGPYANVGTVVGTSPTGQKVTASDASHYFGLASEPAISIRKRTNGQDADLPPGPYIAVGEPVEWRYEVSNAGNTPLTEVSVTDDRELDVDCPQSRLAEGASMVCTASGTAQAGQYSNKAIVVATAPDGAEVSDSDWSHYYGSDPAIALEKRTNGRDADEAPGLFVHVGKGVTWSYVVRNTGNVPLTGLQVIDDQGVDVSCPRSALAPEAAMTCTATGSATEGQYANVGTARAMPPVGDEVSVEDASHYFGIAPGISIQKRTNGQDAGVPPGPLVLVGLDVVWTYAVTNTGNVTLTGMTIADDQGVAVSCPQTWLAPGETMVCQADGVATAGQHINIGTVTGVLPDGSTVTASDASHYLGMALEPSLDVQKRTNGLDADTPPGAYILAGDPVHWEYLVTNAGDAKLADLAVIDDQGVEVTCPKDSLAVGASMTCTGAGVAQAGQYSNLATATGSVVSSGERLSDTDASHYFGSLPGMTLEKSTNGQDADQPPGPYVRAGEAVTWTYTLLNTGNVTLAEVEIDDDQGLAVFCPSTVLAPEQTMVCTATALAELGSYVNVGKAQALPPVGPRLTVSDTSHYFGIPPGAVVYLPVVLRSAGGVFLPQVLRSAGR